MERAALLKFVDLLLRLRHMLEGDSLRLMGKLAKVVLHELARPDINWSGLDTWEAEVVKRITQELGGMPGFMARLISQLLGRVTRKRGVDIAVQTDVSSK